MYLSVNMYVVKRTERIVISDTYSLHQYSHKAKNLYNYASYICSFLDNETIGKHTNYLGRRIKRGLFRS